jgi:hypothetical protein
VEKVLPRRIEVSNDAATRIAIARDWIEKYPAAAEIMIVAHSAEAASDLHLNVLRSRAAWFGVKRFTLNVLASRLLNFRLRLPRRSKSCA